MDQSSGRPRLWLLTIGVLLLMVAVSIGGYVLYKYADDVNVDKLVFDTWVNEKRDLFQALGEFTAPVDNTGNPMRDDSITRSGGGQLKWQTTLFEAEGEYVSSPALVDLNNDGDLEVVVASAGDYVYALGPDGEYFWNTPYGDDIIDYLGQTAGTSGLDFNPPHIFASVISADVNLGDTPEVIIGVKDGALCIDADGTKQWKKGLTTGYYFSTACITDLEGEWSGNKEDLEIVLASDDEGRRGWIEAFEVDGGAIFREEASTGSEGGLIGCSVVAHDLDGDFWDGPFLINPDISKERDTELIIGNHDRGLRIWARQGENADGKPNYDEATSGNLAGHQTYATSAVANVTGSPEVEIFVGSSEGYPVDWTGWGGKLYVYNYDGRQKLWDYTTGSSRASIFSSPAVADLQVAKDDPEEKHLDYEVIFGCDNGNMYVMNTEFHSLLWQFDTGDRCMSSPAICNIDNDDELEIIIGSNSGKVFCFDGDPSDGTDEGVPYPGDGPNQDVLWVYDTGSPIGISSPAVADIDLDGMLEVIIGDQEGHVYCIAAGGRAVRGQADWPEFHYDLNRTGFYNPQTSYGVDVYFRTDENGRPDPSVKYVPPGGYVTFNLTVENTGKGISEINRDKIYVKIDQESVPEGWTAWLDTPPDRGNDNPDYVRLASEETAALILKVNAPWEGRIGEMARINVSANSSQDQWAEDTVTTLTVLDLFVDFDLFFLKQVDTDPLSPLVNKKWDKINPGAEGLYVVSINNKGNLNDSYELELSTPPRDAGWNWYFIETGTLNATTELVSPYLADVFGGISGQTFTIKVECPIDASKDTQIPILLKGTSVLSKGADIEEITQKDELIMWVGEQNEIQLKIEDSTKYVDPNGTVEYYLLITNLGNKDVINVLLSVEGKISGWEVKYPEEPIPVYQGQTKTVPIRVKAPGWARANSKLVLNIIGVIEGATNFRSSAPLTVIVNHVFDFDAVVIEKGVNVDPGKTVWFTMQISNLGNGEDVIKPSAYEIKLEWNLTFYNKEGFQKYEVQIDYNTNIFLLGRLKVPENTRTGPYVVGVNLTGEGSSKVVYIKVFVNQTFDLHVTSSDGENNITANVRPDQERPFVIKVSNYGNGLEEVTLRLGATYDHANDQMDVLYDGWEGKFVAVANTPDFTTNIRPYNFNDKIVVSNLQSDVYYTPNFTAAATSGVEIDEIREIVLILDKGMTAWVHLTLKAPAFEVGELTGTGIEVAGRGVGPKDWDVTHLTLFVLFPDMEFVGKVDFSGGTSDGKDAKVGDVLTIIVRIVNSGDIPAENVDIQLLIDGIEKKVSTLKTVKNDTEDVKTVIFSWVAEAGEHDVKVVIDPDNTVIESHDQFQRGGEGNNNEIRTKVEVEGSFVVKELVNDYPIVSTLLIILLAIVVLVGAALLMKGSKKMS